MHPDDELVLGTRPFSSDNGWVQHVVPSFAALSSEPAGKMSCNDDPVLGAVLLDLLLQYFILFGGPEAAGVHSLIWN